MSDLQCLVSPQLATTSISAEPPSPLLTHGRADADLRSGTGTSKPVTISIRPHVDIDERHGGASAFPGPSRWAWEGGYAGFCWAM